jgi:hypothetical protein
MFELLSVMYTSTSSLAGGSSLDLEAVVIDSFPSHSPVHHRPEHDPRAWPFQNPVTVLSIPKMQRSCSQTAAMAYVHQLRLASVPKCDVSAAYQILGPQAPVRCFFLYRSDRSPERVRSQIFSSVSPSSIVFLSSLLLFCNRAPTPQL